MATAIRLTRIGKKNRIQFRIAVFDKHTRRDGRYLENIGWYVPWEETFEKKVHLNVERAKFWIGNGAQPSNTVWDFLNKLGVSRPTQTRKPKTDEQKKAAATKAAANKKAFSSPRPKGEGAGATLAGGKGAARRRKG
jgi:small subunit ribosomal protein S16